MCFSIIFSAKRQGEVQTLYSEASVSKCLELSAYAAAVLVRSVLAPCNKLLYLAQLIE